MPEEARSMSAAPKPGRTFRALKTIHNQHERAMKAADREAGKGLREFIKSETEGVGKDEKDTFSRDVAALQRVFPDVLEAVERSELSHSRLSGYLGPIEKPRRMVTGVEHFVGGLAIAAQALDRPIVGVAGGVEFRIEPSYDRQSAIRSYYGSAATVSAMRGGVDMPVSTIGAIASQDY